MKSEVFFLKEIKRVILILKYFFIKVRRVRKKKDFYIRSHMIKKKALNYWRNYVICIVKKNNLK